jgi:UDP-N-acetylmuramyl pentapeptide synthase
MVFRLGAGRHNAMNALIALAVCDAIGADVAEAAMALAGGRRSRAGARASGSISAARAIW